MDDDFSWLGRAIDNRNMQWTLSFIGEDQLRKLSELTSALRGVDRFGRKYIPSGFAYWGSGPTVAWSNACNDQLYRVMQASIQSFRGRWEKVAPPSSFVRTRPFHYASLGVGTGQKDRWILQTLREVNPDLFFFPVDMSPEMLRLGVNHIESQGLGLRRSHIVPVQIDFAGEPNLKRLKGLLNEIVGDQPILFSLLGNTLANFEDDEAVMNQLGTDLLRRGDVFLLEVASTEGLSDQAARDAEREYSNSEQFMRWVQSALIQNTNVNVERANVEITSEVEERKNGIKITAVYRSDEGKDGSFLLPGHDHPVDFPDGDEIRLLVTRKYTQKGIESIVQLSPMKTEEFFLSEPSSDGFAMNLLLLKPGEDASPRR